MAERPRGPADGLPRYVGSVRVHRPGFVEFTFSVGDPSVSLDMILPTAAFEAFCREQNAILLADGPDELAATPGAPRGAPNPEWTQ